METRFELAFSSGGVVHIVYICGAGMNGAIRAGMKYLHDFSSDPMDVLKHERFEFTVSIFDNDANFSKYYNDVLKSEIESEIVELAVLDLTGVM